MTTADALAVVVVTHDSEPHLSALLTAVLEQLGPDDEVVVVDNDSGDATVAVARGYGDRVQVIETWANLGFGGGCHVGARHTSAPLLLFLNPDSRPEPDCLEQLRSASRRFPEWGAWQAVVLMPGNLINTDGGVVHYLGMGWAGHCGQPASGAAAEPHLAAFPSGAAMVVRRSVWDRLGGFDSSYFLYVEDLDFGLRVWLAGHAVGVVPEARVVHSYDFEKGTQKWFLLERNRLRTVLSVYPSWLLGLLWPALLGAELVLLALAWREGWAAAKLRSQVAVLAELPRILGRRRSIQATRQVSPATFAAQLTASLESDYLPSVGQGPAARMQASYWAGVRRVLDRLAA